MLGNRLRIFAVKLVVVVSSGSTVVGAPAEMADGYHGIWYMNQPTSDEFGYKYSGGLGTYPQQHVPIAIYSAAANKTFFCYGGSTAQSRELACMVSYFDHATGQVPRPRIVLVKLTKDAHENPTLQIDNTGHLWVFCNSHGPAKNSYIFRSVAPYSITEFEQVARTNFSYSQPWFMPGQGFLFLHTRYQKGRRNLYWMTTPDGREWSNATLLAAVEEGHYQVSNRRGSRIATAFNYHPQSGGLNGRTNLYYLETKDMGATWQTVSGNVVATPLIEQHNAALVHDYEAEQRLVYLKDLNFDAAGRPVILFLTSRDYVPGPKAGPRQWYIAHWTSEKWNISSFTTSDHNYDYGSLFIEDGEWRIIAPTEPGPQPWTAGGEMLLWTSRDEGRTWQREKQLTSGSRYNHTYARRPVAARPQFYAFWADGHSLEPSPSRFYFTDCVGTHVWRLPTEMTDEFAIPDIAW